MRLKQFEWCILEGAESVHPVLNLISTVSKMKKGRDDVLYHKRGVERELVSCRRLIESTKLQVQVHSRTVTSSDQIDQWSLNHWSSREMTHNLE